MDSAEHVPKERLELEIAKARLRLAASRAEPTRLLKESVKASPMSSVAVASLAGALLALLRRRGGGSLATRLRSLINPLIEGFAAGARQGRE